MSSFWIMSCCVTSTRLDLLAFLKVLHRWLVRWVFSGVEARWLLRKVYDSHDSSVFLASSSSSWKVFGFIILLQLRILFFFFFTRMHTGGRSVSLKNGASLPLSWRSHNAFHLISSWKATCLKIEVGQHWLYPLHLGSLVDGVRPTLCVWKPTSGAFPVECADRSQKSRLSPSNTMHHQSCAGVQIQ